MTFMGLVLAGLGARKVLELAKPSVRHVELTVTISTWHKTEVEDDRR